MASVEARGRMVCQPFRPKPRDERPATAKRQGGESLLIRLLEDGLKSRRVANGRTVRGSPNVDLRPPEVTKKGARAPRSRNQDLTDGRARPKHVGRSTPPEGVPRRREADIGADAPEPGAKRGFGPEKKTIRFQT